MNEIIIALSCWVLLGSAIVYFIYKMIWEDDQYNE